MIEPARRLRAAGFEPVPHIAVRHTPTADALDELIARLAAEAGVRRILVIAGDRDRPAGPFGSTIELIESGLLQRHGIAEIGVAGYPDGHPRLSADALDRALAAKVEAAGQTGLRLHIVTQFCFDAEPILRWLARLRDTGIEHPVRIGLAGPTTLTTLLRYARRCGVSASAQGLTRHAGLLKHLVGTTAPDGIIRTLAEAAPGRIGEVALHFFSFGGAAATARWAQAAADGRITLDRARGVQRASAVAGPRHPAVNAAIVRKHLAGHVSRRVARQIDDKAGKVFRRAHATHRDRSFDESLEAGELLGCRDGASRAAEIGTGMPARRDRVCPKPFGCILHRELTREADHAGLGGPVRDGSDRKSGICADHAEIRREVDDRRAPRSR